jgi:hypothetical protein
MRRLSEPTWREGPTEVNGIPGWARAFEPVQYGLNGSGFRIDLLVKGVWHGFSGPGLALCFVW